MNTNEFRHPKERLQNLSSRYKVSKVFLGAFWSDTLRNMDVLTSDIAYRLASVQDRCLHMVKGSSGY